MIKNIQPQIRRQGKQLPRHQPIQMANPFNLNLSLYGTFQLLNIPLPLTVDTVTGNPVVRKSTMLPRASPVHGYAFLRISCHFHPSQLAAVRFPADFVEGVGATEALLGKDAETDRIREGISKGSRLAETEGGRAGM
jgi:hypothetical protein